MTTIIEQLASIVGDRYLLDPAGDDAAPFTAEARGDYVSEPAAIVLPGSTDEVARVVAACAGARVPLVPQGGNTGLCAGAVAGRGEVILSLKRLNRIRDVDAVDGTMTVEAGCILADIQDAAEAAGRFFPVSLGAEGSCMIGGNLSTNAGGINVLRYGNTREQVLGLEVVLADGRTWHGLNALYKNNTGYDLKHLFVGAEGTLGIVTAACLRLYPRPLRSITVLAGFPRLADCPELLSRARAVSGDQLSSFELIPDIAMQSAAAHVPGCDNPLAGRHDWYILSQFATSSPVIALDDIAQAFLEDAAESGLVDDAVISSSAEQENALWRIREGIVAAQRKVGRSVSHDVSVPVSKVPELIERVAAELARTAPGARLYPFGHIGDGNVHCNVLQPVDMSEEDFVAAKPLVRRAVYGVVAALGGSFSAEHGVGLLKKGLMAEHKSAVELDLMRTLRKALDPAGLLNPGKVV